MLDISVLDSSAAIAFLRNEAGGAKLASVTIGALLSTVNLSEIHSKLIQKGVPEGVSWSMILGLECNLCPFTVEQGKLAAELIQATRPFGLSLGDRACLALAIERKAKVYTADRSWKNLSLDLEIEVIR